MAIEKINGMQQSIKIQSNGVKKEHHKEQASTDSQSNNKFLYTSLSGLAVLAATGTAIYKARKGKNTTNDIKEFGSSTNETIKATISHFKKGLAYETKDKLFTGTIEKTSNAGNRRIIEYINGKRIKTTYIPKEGLISQIERTFNGEFGGPRISTTLTKTKDGQTYKIIETLGNKNNEKIELPYTIKNGIAYDKDGSLFTGKVTHTSRSGSKLHVFYSNGKKTNANYIPANDPNIKNISKIYTDTIKGVRLVDSVTYFKDKKISTTTTSIIETNKKFPKDIENIIPKKVFDGYLDKDFLVKFPASGYNVKRYDLGNGLIMTETPISGTNKISRTLSKDYKLIRQIEIENTPNARPEVIKFSTPENAWVKISSQGSIMTKPDGEVVEFKSPTHLP